MSTLQARLAIVATNGCVCTLDFASLGEAQDAFIKAMNARGRRSPFVFHSDFVTHSIRGKDIAQVTLIDLAKHKELTSGSDA